MLSRHCESVRCRSSYQVNTRLIPTYIVLGFTNKHYGVEAIMYNQRRRDDDAEEESETRHPIFNQRAYQGAIEQQIAAAQSQGLFNNLPGAGKPLGGDDDVFVPEDVRVGYRMLKSAGFAPPWIEQKKEIVEVQSKLALWLDSANARWRHAAPSERERLQNLYREKLVYLNRIILNYNLTVPQTIGQMPGIRMQDELVKLG